MTEVRPRQRPHPRTRYHQYRCHGNTGFPLTQWPVNLAEKAPVSGRDMNLNRNESDPKLPRPNRSERLRSVKLIGAALWYASLGFGVFPVKAGSKIPATKHGFKDASLNPNVIQTSFRPAHNMGLIAPDEVLILDFDVPKDSRSLADRLAETHRIVSQLENTYTEVGRAPAHTTPSGGVHIFIRLPQKARRLTTGSWPKGAKRAHGDLRGMGRAYVVAPPSTTNEGAYSVRRPLVHAEELPVASLALLDYLDPTRQMRPGTRSNTTRPNPSMRNRTLAVLVNEVRSAPEGTRNTTLNRCAFVAGKLAAAGTFDYAVGEHQLLVAAVDAGLSQREALATIRSAMNAAMRKGRHV